MAMMKKCQGLPTCRSGHADVPQMPSVRMPDDKHPSHAVHSHMRWVIGLCYCLLAQTVNKCPFLGLLSGMLFHFLWLLLVILLFEKAPKQSPEVLFRAPDHGAVVHMEQVFLPALSVAASHEFSVNESTIYAK